MFKPHVRESCTVPVQQVGFYLLINNNSDTEPNPATLLAGVSPNPNALYSRLTKPPQVADRGTALDSVCVFIDVLSVLICSKAPMSSKDRGQSEDSGWVSPCEAGRQAAARLAPFCGERQGRRGFSQSLRHKTPALSPDLSLKSSQKQRAGSRKLNFFHLTSQQHKGDDVCMSEWNTVRWVSIDNRADDGDRNQHIKSRSASATSI